MSRNKNKMTTELAITILIYSLILGAAIGLIVLMVWLIRRHREFLFGLDMVFLRVCVGKRDSKEDGEKEFHKSRSWQDVIGIMEHFFGAVRALYSSWIKEQVIGQAFLSFEYVVQDKQLDFYVVVPRVYASIIEKQVTSFYPDSFTERVEDYNIFREGQHYLTTEAKLDKSHIYPIKTYKKLTSDPLNGIVNAFAKFNVDEGAVVQISIRPLHPRWQNKVRRKAKSVFKGQKEFWLSSPFRAIGHVWDLFFQGATDDNIKQMTAADTNTGNRNEITPMVEEKVKAMEEKSNRVGFDTVMRIIVSSPSKHEAHAHLENLKGAFAQFTCPDTNHIEFTMFHSPRKLIKHYIYRLMRRSWLVWIQHRLIMCTEELASLFHFPSAKWNESPVVNWQTFKVEAAPSNLPKEGLTLGINEYRGEKREVKIKNEDRMRHFYIIGKSGTGKSTLLDNMLRQDVKNGKGLCLVDPHGDLVEAILPYIPRERADDVIIFDPADQERPLGLNILEGETWDQKEFMTQESLSIFIKMFGEEIMGPRLQNYFRNGCLTLMSDDEEGATLIDLPRLFVDEPFQKYKIKKVTNPIVKAFWEKEMASSGQREKQEIIPYFSSKFGPFVTNNQIRNIIGQPKSSFDFRKVMDEGKILLVNLSKGKLGDLNSQLVGMIMVAKIQMAAMSRVDIAEDERRDFFLYVDEFQNFVTDSFATILSEARKYRLGLIVAHQYINQIAKMKVAGKGMTDDSTIKDAVFGNVGTMMTFKIGATDAEPMAKEFAPVFSEQDLVNIANYKAYIKLNIDNATSRGFSMNTIYDPSGKDKESAEAIRQLSRLVHARDREFVEKEIFQRYGV